MKYSEDQNVDYNAVIVNYVNENYVEANKSILASNVDISEATISEEGEMTATITATVPTSFLKFVHFDEFEFTISSGVMVGGSAIEISLVLDNTYSMNGSKLTALKGAANDLLDVIYPVDFDNTGDRIKFAVVPFAEYVNISEKQGNVYNVVGRGDRDEPGLDIPDDYRRTWHEEAGEECHNTYPNSNRKCTPKPRGGWVTNDGVTSWDPNKWNGQNCTGSLGKPVKVCEWEEGEEHHKDYKWKGCMGSRAHDLNTKDEGYSTKVPGMMMDYNLCKHTATMTRLTGDREAITDGIAAMKAKYSTYIPSGLMWGWRALSPTAPFADGVEYGNGAVRKVIVLMTDGANTKKAWGKWNGLENESASWKKKLGYRSMHNTTDVYGHNGTWNAASAANAITAELCANIKTKDIMVYTIGFDIEEDSDIENLMKACAGKGGQYFSADNSTELADAFKEIGKSLLNLRLTH